MKHASITVLLLAAALFTVADGQAQFAPSAPFAQPNPSAPFAQPAKPNPADEKKAAEEKAAREKAAREKAAKEKAAREKAAKEKAAKEKAAKEKAAREKKAAEEKAAREKAAKEKAAREKAAKEKAAREKKEAEEKAAREKARQEAEEEDEPTADSHGDFSFGQPGSKPVETVEVSAKGQGESVEAAKKDAVRNAIKQAVGELVGTKTLVENDELVQDKILTLSNAMVEKAEYGSAKSIGGGLVEVPVKARVKKGQLNRELKKIGVTKGRIDGESIAIKLGTGKERVANAEKFLVERFRDFPGNIVEGVMLAKKDGTPDIEVNEDTGHVFANVGLRVNMENYLKWTQALCELLGAMCIEKEEVNIAFEERSYQKTMYQVSFRSLSSLIKLREIPPQKTYGTSDSQRKAPLAVIVATPSAKGAKRSSWPATIYYLDLKMFRAFCKQAAMRFAEREQGTVEVVLKDDDDGPVCSGKGSLNVSSYIDNTSMSLSGLLPIKFPASYYSSAPAVVAPDLAIEFENHYLVRSASLTLKLRLDLGKVEEDDIADVTGYEVKVDYPPPRPEFGKEE